MGASKPTLGYGSRTEAVHGLRAQGIPTAQIARAIGISVSTVSALEAGSSRPRRMPRPSEERGRTVVVPTDILDRLGPPAARRGIHPNSLARLILETVVDENMIDAVLDDAAGHEPF
ncbi:hypothetical protein FHS96_004955 [Sphingomonas zeicaulis]|uniref:helix-turn-helix domain-containing protein n=1 Tax=Sphingomonas zeicaulis TaxID=1632740 RepID=UPI003D19A7F4